MKESNFGMARKIVASMTTDSWQTIPHAVMTYDLDVTGMLEKLRVLNSSLDKLRKITINTLMLKLIAECLKACPKLNSHIDYNRWLVRGKVKELDSIDISLPMTLSSGEMMTLNIRNVGNLSLGELSDEIKDVRRRADNTILDEVFFEAAMDNSMNMLKHGHVLKVIGRLIGTRVGKNRVKLLKGAAKRNYYAIPETDRLTKHDIEQGSITVSNFGSVHKNWSGGCTILEIIPPQTTAIAIGAIDKKAIVKNDEIVVGNVLPLTIAFDHRAMDLGDVTSFLNKLDELIEDLSWIEV